MTTYTDEVKFCMKYLLEHDIGPEDIPELVEQAADYNVKFSLVKLEKSYWLDVAESLRKIWPAGEKDGKYPWRDSASNIEKRLEWLMSTSLVKKQYTKEQILTVARKYVAQFQEDTKYMKILKYFIYKQDRTIQPDGKIKVSNASTLASMLESAEEQGWFIEDNSTVTGEIGEFAWEGELV